MGILLQQVSSYLPADLRGGQGKALVAAAGLHLKGVHRLQRGTEIGCRRLPDGLQILFHHLGPGKGGYAENPGNPVAGLIQIGGGVLGLDINGGLGLAQPEIPGGRQPPAQIFQQYVFKGAAIEPF